MTVKKENPLLKLIQMKILILKIKNKENLNLKNVKIFKLFYLKQKQIQN